MAQEKKETNKFNFAKIFAGILLIIISMLLLTNILKKFKNERLKTKQNAINSYANENLDNKYIIKNEEQSRNNTKKNKTQNGIGDIDIPELFGTTVPNVNSSIKNNSGSNKKQTQNNNEYVEYEPEFEENTNKQKNTKESAIKENKNNIKTNLELERLKENSYKNINKYIEEFAGDTKRAKNLYVLNLIRKMLTPILIAVIIFSYVYQYLIGLKDNKIWKKGYYIRIISVILLLVIQLTPLIYSLIVKSWRI